MYTQLDEMESLLPQDQDEEDGTLATPQQLAIANEVCTPHDWHDWCLFAAQGSVGIALVCGVLVGVSLPVLVVVVAPNMFEGISMLEVFAKSIALCTAVFAAIAAPPALGCYGASFFCNRRSQPGLDLASETHRLRLN